jgi:hypothetical protein
MAETVATYTPVAIGPTWKRGDDGKFLLPKHSLGWAVFAWTAQWLQHDDGSPWRYTPEQARFVLWWYAIDDTGRFVYRDGVFQRLKGHGKDPLVATLACTELVGPCRFGGWGDDGEPIVVHNPTAWVQIAATSKDQTRTTMRIFPSLLTKRAKAEYSIDVGRELIYAHHGDQMIESVTSSPRALEGGRASFVVKNETQHWLRNNEGYEMAAVIDRNAAKIKGGSARALSITNAYEPSEESVAQAEREAWEAMESGASLASGLLYDSLEAPPEAPLTPEAIPLVIEAVRGDSHWLDAKRIAASIMDPRNPPSRSRRFWFNQIVAAEDAWLDPNDFDLCVAGSGVAPLTQRDEIALFFDGGKTDDPSALVGARLSDGLVVTLGMWQRPPGERGKGWIAPRAVIDDAVDRVMDAYRVVGFFADPSHTTDDETGERFWDGIIDDWHRRYGDRLEVWASPSRTSGHAVMWDMTAPSRVDQFTAAAERCATEIEEHILLHDGDPRLRTHARNARRYPNRYGVSLWKGHRESPRKVDLAVAMVGARMVRRLVLNNPSRKRRRSGKVW